MVSVIRYSLIKIDIRSYITIGTMQGNAEFTREFFDQSSEAWSKNKIRKGHCMAYKCAALTREGNPCSKAAAIKDGTSDHLCKQHKMYTINKKIELLAALVKATH